MSYFEQFEVKKRAKFRLSEVVPICFTLPKTYWYISLKYLFTETCSLKRNSQKLFCDATHDAICDGRVRCELAKYHSQKKSAMRPSLADLDTSPWYSRGLVQLVHIYRQLLNRCTTLLWKRPTSYAKSLVPSQKLSQAQLPRWPCCGSCVGSAMVVIWGFPSFAAVASRVASLKSFCESRFIRKWKPPNIDHCIKHLYMDISKHGS